MIFPIPIPIFIQRFFQINKTNQETIQRHKEIDVHCEIVNIKVSIQREAEEEFNKVYNKLSDKQKKYIDKESYLGWTKRIGFIFPTRGDYLDAKRYKCEKLLEANESNKEKGNGE